MKEKSRLPDITCTAVNKLNISRFAEALARAVTMQYERDYPGIQITVKDIVRKSDSLQTAKGGNECT